MGCYVIKKKCVCKCICSFVSLLRTLFVRFHTVNQLLRHLITLNVLIEVEFSLKLRGCIFYPNGTHSHTYFRFHCIHLQLGRKSGTFTQFLFLLCLRQKKKKMFLLLIPFCTHFKGLLPQLLISKSIYARNHSI